MDRRVSGPTVDAVRSYSSSNSPARQGTIPSSSAINRALETTTVTGYSSSTSSDMNMHPLPESRKRSRDTDSEDSLDEEERRQRVRLGHYNSRQYGEQQNTSSGAARRRMTAIRGRPYSFPVGRRSVHRGGQEYISYESADMDVSATPALAFSPVEVDRVFQPTATLSTQESTSHKRSYKEDSGSSDESDENERPYKVRRRGDQQAPPRSPTPRSRISVGGVSHRFPNNERRNRSRSETPREVKSQVENEVLATPDAVENNDSEAEAVLAPSETSAAETPSAKNDEPRIEGPIVIDLTADSSDGEAENSDEGDEVPPTPIGEQRLEPFIPVPTAEFKALLHEVETETMYHFYNEPGDTAGQREEIYLVIGSTGNIYDLKIAKKPSCSCWEGRLGHICKHIIFILVNVLMVEAPLRHQVAFLSTEVNAMLDAVIIDDYCERKPVEDCSFCVNPLDDEDNITWCRNQCGANFHKTCVLTWATTIWDAKPHPDDPTIIHKCGHCRAPWVFTKKELHMICKESVEKGRTGMYYNVSEALGMQAPEWTDADEQSHRRFVQEAGGLRLRPAAPINEEENPPRDYDADDEDAAG